MALIVSFPLTQAVGAADSGADAVFVGKVSQGGMCEVEASQIAKQRAIAQDVYDISHTTDLIVKRRNGALHRTD